MNIAHLRTLIAAVDSGSFAGASAQIGRTQSAVSLQIKGLEQSVGVALFDRSLRPPVPTPQGRELAEHARKIIALYDAVPDIVGGDQIRGTLRVGAVPTVLSSFLPTALAQLRAKHQDLTIDVHSGSSAGLAAQLAQGALDVVVCTRPYQPISGLIWHFVQHEPCVVVAPTDVPGDAACLLSTQPFIWFNRQAWAGAGIEAALQAQNIHVNATMEIDSMDAIASMVRAGLGVSILPVCRGSLGRWPGLRAVPFGDPVHTREIGALLPVQGQGDATVQAFLAAL